MQLGRREGKLLPGNRRHRAGDPPGADTVTMTAGRSARPPSFTDCHTPGSTNLRQEIDELSLNAMPNALPVLPGRHIPP